MKNIVKMEKEKRFVATCAFGLEDMVRGEVTAFGGSEALAAAGSVAFFRVPKTAYRLCLWSRFATRVLLPLRSFCAKDATRFTARRARWIGTITSTRIRPFWLKSAAKRSPIRNTHFADCRVKDAVVDQFKD